MKKIFKNKTFSISLLSLLLSVILFMSPQTIFIGFIFSLLAFIFSIIDLRKKETQSKKSSILIVILSSILLLISIVIFIILSISWYHFTNELEDNTNTEKEYIINKDTMAIEWKLYKNTHS